MNSRGNTLVATTATKMDAGLPECLTLCMQGELPKSKCEPANSTCICIDEYLNTAIKSCVAANCTIIESLPRTPLVSRAFTVSWDDGCIIVSLLALIVVDICTHISFIKGEVQGIL
ncbi:hypothetical protein LZ31DRAFT_611005 [Colletotrichum somersetense]|nr:hypothetical protein LZ31DRAFT_611005 [Colletotrichum somersetense]